MRPLRPVKSEFFFFVEAHVTEDTLQPTQRRIRALMCHGALDLRLEHLLPDADNPKAIGARQLRVRVAFGPVH